MRYVLITPARNEAKFISVTLESVVAQSVLPIKWIIVNDGSTDETQSIVERYSIKNPWIELVNLPLGRKRDFSGKVFAFNAGLDRLKSVEFDFIGSLDADLSFPSGYFDFLMRQFNADSKLGLAGTPFLENGKSYDFRFSSQNHVSGACQLFRRACFRDIGGYQPLKHGGIDVVAALTARMRGWNVCTFTEMPMIHHRPMGTAQTSLLRASFNLGRKDYLLGRHPLWQMFRSIYQLTRPPVIIGGAGLLLGYSWAAITLKRPAVSDELVAFQRRDQMLRLKRAIFR